MYRNVFTEVLIYKINLNLKIIVILDLWFETVMSYYPRVKNDNRD